MECVIGLTVGGALQLAVVTVSVTVIRCLPLQSVVAPSGECLRDKGVYGVI